MLKQEKLQGLAPPFLTERSMDPLCIWNVFTVFTQEIQGVIALNVSSLLRNFHLCIYDEHELYIVWIMQYAENVGIKDRTVKEPSHKLIYSDINLHFATHRVRSFFCSRSNM